MVAPDSTSPKVKYPVHMDVSVLKNPKINKFHKILENTENSIVKLREFLGIGKPLIVFEIIIHDMDGFLLKVFRYFRILVQHVSQVT